MPLKPRDKKVVDAFLNRKPAESNVLESDGKKLRIVGLFGGDVAEWQGYKVVVTSPEATRLDKMILRYLTKRGGGVVKMASIKVADIRLTPKDKKVIQAFLDKKPAESKKVESTGKELRTTGMGRGTVAKWVGSKIEVQDLSSRSEQTVAKALKKMGGGTVKWASTSNDEGFIIEACIKPKMASRIVEKFLEKRAAISPALRKKVKDNKEILNPNEMYEIEKITNKYVDKVERQLKSAWLGLIKTNQTDEDIRFRTIDSNLAVGLPLKSLLTLAEDETVYVIPARASLQRGRFYRPSALVPLDEVVDSIKEGSLEDILDYYKLR